MKVYSSKKFSISIILLLSILQLAYPMPTTNLNENMPKNEKAGLNEDCPIISSETAVFIAKGILCFDYDLSDRKVTVETETKLWKEKGEMWKVTFRRTKDQESFGGDPIVWIFKRNGERFTVKHAK